MRRTNRIEPSNIDAKYLTCAIMITTTQLEIIRRVEITPTTQSFTDPIRPRIERSCTSTPIKPSRKILWCIGCLFFAAGILALLIMITGLTIIFRRINTIRKSNIERYDLGDLHYGINKVYYPSNTYLSNINKASIQAYLSDQLRNEPGYRGLMIDEIFVQDKFDTNKRKQRDTSCSIIFIIQNTQVYFDPCPTCVNKRNLILRRLFFNRTAFREPFYLLLNNQYLFAQICSTPNKSQLIIPKQLNISDVEKIDTNLKSTSSILPQMDSLISNDISTAVSTMNTTDHSSTITSLDSIRTEETSSFDTSTYQSITTKTSSQKTTIDRFEFLPFRPSTTTNSPWRLIRQPYHVINNTKIDENSFP